MMSNCDLQPAWDLGARWFVVIETPHQPPERGIGVLKPLARALQVALTRLRHLEVEWFSQRCPVVTLEPELLMDGHTFNDFTKTEELMDKGQQWTEEFLGSEEGELLRSFARHRDVE